MALVGRRQAGTQQHHSGKYQTPPPPEAPTDLPRRNASIEKLAAGDNAQLFMRTVTEVIGRLHAVRLADHTARSQRLGPACG